MNSDLFPVVVKETRLERFDVKTFLLNQHPAIQYKAGQFLKLAFTLADGSTIYRSYSFSSAPGLDAFPAITIKRVDNGRSSRILFDNIHPGDVLLSNGVGGLFTLPDAIDHNALFVFWAAGVGITPIWPMIRTLLLRSPTAKAILVYSNRNPDEAVFREQIEALQIQYAERFRIVPIYSNSKNLNRARLHRGLIPELLEELGTGFSVTDQWHYICGPLEYRRLLAWSLEEAGIPSSRIRKEVFQVDLPIPKILPPDTGTHNVTLLGREHPERFAVASPDTILQAARKAGINLPFSCEAGRCGSCIARCTSGHVWHSYNEVLTDTELQLGIILTCTGHPVGGDVTLEL